MTRSLLTIAFLYITSPTLLMASDLFFNASDSATVTTYDLQLKDANTVKTIWSRQVPLVNGVRPAHWCSLVEWQRNERGMLALINYDNFQGKLLLFGPNNNLIAEMGIGKRWLRSDLFGTVKLEPPDKIKFIDNKGEVIDEYSVRNGALYDRDGNPNQKVTKTIKVGSTLSELTTQRIEDVAAVVDSPSAASLEQKMGMETTAVGSPSKSEITFLSSGSVVLVVFVTAMGLLWVFLKKRQSR